MKKYLSYLKRNNYSINTIRTYNSVLRKYQFYMYDIRLIKKELKKYFNSPNTSQLHYNVICSYLKFKKDKRLNELKKLKLPNIPYKYLEVFKKEFLENKTKILMDDSKEIINKKNTIKFLFETGIRAEEIKNIIKVNEKTLIIMGKGKKIREIFYNNKTFKEMEDFKYTSKTLRIWVKEILGNEYTPHSIRRSHATHMLLNGANPKTVMLQLGHAKIETTFRYLQLNMDININEYKKYF